MFRIVVVTLLALAICAGLSLTDYALRLLRSRWSTMIRMLLGLVLLSAFVYVALQLTIFGRPASEVRQAEFEPFWSFRESLSLIEGELGVTNAGLLEQIVLNVLFFMPLGALLPFAAPWVFAGRGLGGLLATGVVALCCSLAIEISQWYLSVGLFELDDLMNNTLGALLGWVMYGLGCRLCDVSRDLGDAN